MRFSKLLFVLALVLCLGATVPLAQATVILEGSDAIGLHSRFGDAGAITYRDQTWIAIGGADPRPIAFIGDSLSGVGSGTHAVSTFASVAAAGTLTNYVALYFQAGGGCCAENDSLITAPGAQAAVAAYLGTPGATVMIGNYIGGAAWDFAVGTTGGANNQVAGFAGGLSGSTCSDGEQVNATGLANGFTQPPVIGCWTHQGYNQAGFFAALGFTLSFFDAGPDYPAGFSSLLSNGRTVTGGGGGVPEPASLLLLGTGLVGLAAMARRRRQK